MAERELDGEEISLAVSELAELGVLRAWLSQVSQLELEIAPGTPGPGEQGVQDVLTVLASAPALIAAVKVLPEFIRSRRSGFRIEATVRGRKFVVDATNSEDLLAALERLLDE